MLLEMTYGSLSVSQRQFPEALNGSAAMAVLETEVVCDSSKIENCFSSPPLSSSFPLLLHLLLLFQFREWEEEKE